MVRESCSRCCTRNLWLTRFARAAFASGKWYEGRLIEGHLHLITAFLCLIAVLGAIEQGGGSRGAAMTRAMEPRGSRAQTPAAPV